MYSAFLRKASANFLKTKSIHPIFREVKLTCLCTRQQPLRFKHSGTPKIPKDSPVKNGSASKNYVVILKNYLKGWKKKDLVRMFRLAKPERYKIYGAIFFLLISSSISNLVPMFFGKLIDLMSSAADDGTLLENLKSKSSILLLIFVIGGIANCCRFYLFTVAGQNIIKKLRENVFRSILKQEMGFYDKNKTGELINRLSTDTTVVGKSITNNISEGLRALASGSIAVTMMLYISPKLTLVAMAIVPAVVGFAIIYGRFVKRITKEIQDTLADSTQVAEERISNIRTVRAFAHEIKEMKAYDNKIEEILQLQKKEAKYSALFWGFTGTSGNAAVLSVIYCGGIMMSESQLSVGGLTSFIVYAIYIGISLSSMTSFYTEIMRGLGASSRLWELSERNPLIPIAGNIYLHHFNFESNILFRNIRFSFPTRSDVNIFNHLNLTVPSGSVTAVVGASGSGKSSLGHLLLRFYDPQFGEVCLDDININKLDPTWLRQHIGTVSQEPILFSCSIADNIKYGASENNVTTEDMMNAARQANAYQFIQNFPQQFDTLVGERGIMLSGGQRQRIAIARAILKNPKILLLDEATSALDAESEYWVQDALERLMEGRTVITIAHRLSTIKTANQIAVLDQGQIAEVGSYNDLIQIPDGIFKKLVDRQTITN
ncbi:hypothetical protein LOTGIDRAFT_214550 [Lottia gigantea]|uniref:ATP-binding cassette sub-family B member 10, mitochondrial n=1 Tax=Lottia gigantea TaxID=225164 RepID=V4C4C8_LOTGI|nr:hypothetical protein LOTGIDRAFT_214550 [Lottia gigantea]ESO96389.1 hypothetical protein LOTGIDRAFT_214550 [Lottia gigantea]